MIQNRTAFRKWLAGHPEFVSSAADVAWLAWQGAMAERARTAFHNKLGEAYCVVYPDGRLVLDSDFDSEDRAWQTALGWPSKEEIEWHKTRGARCVKATVVW